MGKYPWSYPGSVAPSLLVFSAPSAHAGLFLGTSRVKTGFVTDTCGFWAILVSSHSFILGLACPLAPKSTGVNLSLQRVSGSSRHTARHNRQLVKLFWELKSPYLPCLEIKWGGFFSPSCLMPNACDKVSQTTVPLRWAAELLVAVTGEKPGVLVMEGALQRSSSDPHRYLGSC